MSRGLALSDSQLADLRTAANPLPLRLRGRYLAMLGAVLRGRSSIGDAELHRLAHDIVGELLQQHDDERYGRRVETSALKGPSHDALPRLRLAKPSALRYCVDLSLSD
jgi:hypothetical protein